MSDFQDHYDQGEEYGGRSPTPIERLGVIVTSIVVNNALFAYDAVSSLRKIMPERRATMVDVAAADQSPS